MTPEEAMERLPASHFFVLKQFLEDEEERVKPEHWYLARIAREVHCVLLKSSQRRQIKVEDFILKFKKKQRKKINYEENEDEWLDVGGDEDKRLAELKKQAELSKMFWFGMAGVKQVPKWEGVLPRGPSNSIGGPGN